MMLASTNLGEDGLADCLAVGWNFYTANAHQVFVVATLVAGGQNATDAFVDDPWHAVASNVLRASSIVQFAGGDSIPSQ